MTTQDSRRSGGVSQFLDAIANAGLDVLHALRGRRNADRSIGALGEELLSTRGEANGHSRCS
jgi:hypothetical protein